MKHLKKRFSLPDNIFKIHWDTIKTAAAAAFYSFEPFLTQMRVQILFHFRFLCSGWPGSNLMGPNTCPNSGLRPTAQKKFLRIECCFMICKLAQTQSLNIYYFKNHFKPCSFVLKALKVILQHFKFVNW